MKTLKRLFPILALMLCAIAANAQSITTYAAPDTSDPWTIGTIPRYFQGTYTQRQAAAIAQQYGQLWYSTTDSAFYYLTAAGWKPLTIAAGASAVLVATGSVTLSASTLYKTVLDSTAGAIDTVTLYDCTKVPYGFSFDVHRKDTLSTYAIKFKTVSSQAVCGYSNNAAINNSSSVGTITALGAGGGAEFWTDNTKWYIRWQH